MRRRFALATVLFFVLTAAACSGQRGTTGRSSRNVITAEEIAATTAVTAWDAVRRLRPEFVRPRGQVSAADPESSYPLVYVDGVRLGPIERLQGINVSSVDAIEFISATDATTRWGTGHPAGVLLVRTRR